MARTFSDQTGTGRGVIGRWRSQRNLQGCYLSSPVSLWKGKLSDTSYRYFLWAQGHQVTLSQPAVKVTVARNWLNWLLLQRTQADWVLSVHRCSPVWETGFLTKRHIQIRHRTPSRGIDLRAGSYFLVHGWSKVSTWPTEGPVLSGTAWILMASLVGGQRCLI